ncbi:MAG: hypothetical protein ACPG77_09300 [Nannocystaceae bacterium]
MHGAGKLLPLSFLVAVTLGLACGPGPSDTGPENAGSFCDGPADCYPDVDHAALAGDVICVDNVDGGYCTHNCEVDSDCCAVPGECRTNILQVCSPFKNTSTKRCFLSCEVVDLAPGYEDDADRFCSDYMFAGWTCSSSGGGSENRKICKP